MISSKVPISHKGAPARGLEKRRPTEIDFLNGGTARFGAEQGVPTPLDETIAALIKGAEKSWD